LEEQLSCVAVARVGRRHDHIKLGATHHPSDFKNVVGRQMPLMMTD
jgi:hypothetical protein